MEEIIKVTDQNGRQTVSARELHEKLGIKSKFNDWFNRMRVYGFTENTDFVTITQKKVTAQGNESCYEEHYISIDMAKHICMIQKSEKGMKFRNYFIECEKMLIQKLEEEKKFLKTRQKSKIARNMFTDTLKNHGYKNPHEYIQTTKQMKNALGITAKKDEMTEKELQLVLASETISSLTLENEQGYHEVNPVCVDVSKGVIGLIKEQKSKKIEVA